MIGPVVTKRVRTTNQVALPPRLFESKAAPHRPSPWQMCCTEAHMADTKAGGLRPMAKVMVVDDAYSELQVMEYLPKPFTSEQLLTIVRRFLK